MRRLAELRIIGGGGWLARIRAWTWAAGGDGPPGGPTAGCRRSSDHPAARAARAATASTAPPARLRTVYDTGAVIPTALADGGFVEGRADAGVVDAAGGLVGGGSIPTAVAVDGGTSVVGAGRRGDADPRGVLVAVAELVPGELARTGGLVAGDVATDVTTKPEPVTSTFVSGGPLTGSSVMTGLAVRFRNTTGGVGGVVVGVLAACITRANGVRAQTGGVAARQASTWICKMQAWPGMHWPGLIARKLPVSSPAASTEQYDLAAAEPP